MFEVVVDEVKYIWDVPAELTEEAVSAGALKRGSVVGLLVHPPSEPENKVLVDVKLACEGQENMIKPGLRLPLDGEGGIFSFSRDWREYLPEESHVGEPEIGEVSAGPKPGFF